MRTHELDLSEAIKASVSSKIITRLRKLSVTCEYENTNTATDLFLLSWKYYKHYARFKLLTPKYIYFNKM